MSNQDAQVLVLEHPVSSYAQKVKIALREKGVAFIAKIPPTIGSGNLDKSDQLNAINPRGEVPVLVDARNCNGDFSDPAAIKIFDSTIIVEYLEDEFPEQPLLPRKPAERSRARLISNISDTHLEAINWGIAEVRLFKRAEHNPELERKVLEQAARQTAIVTAWLTEQLGNKPFFGGDSFGYADVAVAAVVNRAIKNGTGPKEGSSLYQWRDRIAQRDSVAKTFKEFEDAAGTMGKFAESFRTGERRREYRDHRLEFMVKSGGLEIVDQGIKNNTIRLGWPE